MLTINNFHKKLIGKGPHSKKWFVGSVDETPTQYWLYPNTNKGKPLNRISLERMPMGGKGEYEYEIWWWDNDEPDPAQQKPIRQWLSIKNLKMGAVPLLELIDYMLKLK
jgi:hypothetical protein